MTYKNKKEINQNANLSKNWVINQMNQIERNQKERDPPRRQVNENENQKRNTGTKIKMKLKKRSSKSNSKNETQERKETKEWKR